MIDRKEDCEQLRRINGLAKSNILPVKTTRKDKMGGTVEWQNEKLVNLAISLDPFPKKGTAWTPVVGFREDAETGGATGDG